jgi:hypothetical protein
MMSLKFNYCKKIHKMDKIFTRFTQGVIFYAIFDV